MKTKARLIALALAALIAVPTLASCANDDEENNRNKENGTNATDVNGEPVFEEADFEEAEFRILHYGTTATDYADEYIWAEDYTGNAIGDAVRERNQLTEEMYNVKITAEECGPIGEAVTRMQAGQCDYELIYEWGIRTKSAALDGMLQDFLELDNIDLEASYWVPSATEDLTVSDRLFIYTNYISMNSFAWAGFTYFNKNMCEELQMSMPYEYVQSNSWTYDVYIPMMLSAEADLDGDQEMTPEDRFGLLGSDIGVMESMIAGSGQMTTQKKDDGTYELTINTETARYVYETWADRLAVADTYITLEDVWASGADTSGFPSPHVAGRFLIFGEGHCLFMGGAMDMTKELVDMQDNYGVVPNPKYKADQDSYYSYVDCNAPMFSIPVQAEDMEMVGMVMEYMAYQSEKILLPAFYETTIKTKRMPETVDYDMLDIVRENIRYNWTSLYLYDGTVGGILNQMLTSGNFASVYKRNEAKAMAEIEEVMDKLAEIDA